MRHYTHSVNIPLDKNEIGEGSSGAFVHPDSSLF